jgi:hypothetical protein
MQVERWHNVANLTDQLVGWAIDGIITNAPE